MDQAGSMVEIRRSEAASSSTSEHPKNEEDRYRLLYSKSKVYVQPTAYARDNIPGFVSLVKRVSSIGSSCCEPGRTDGYELCRRL